MNYRSEAIALQRRVCRVRRWKQEGVTPAHGRLLVHPQGKACAVDYGQKVRIFTARRAEWGGHPALPHQYSRSEELRAYPNLGDHAIDP